MIEEGWEWLKVCDFCHKHTYRYFTIKMDISSCDRRMCGMPYVNRILCPECLALYASMHKLSTGDGEYVWKPKKNEEEEQ